MRAEGTDLGEAQAASADPKIPGPCQHMPWPCGRMQLLLTRDDAEALLMAGVQVWVSERAYGPLSLLAPRRLAAVCPSFTLPGAVPMRARQGLAPPCRWAGVV